MLIGWGIEVVGVRTGMVFGRYSYGAPLGLGEFGVPFIIGMNWATLVYCMANLLAPLPYPAWAKSLLTGLLLAGYDALMEPAAIKLGFWRWANGSVDLQNYPAWFATGSVLAGLYFITQKEAPATVNPVAGAILVIQLLFFGMVILL